MRSLLILLALPAAALAQPPSLTLPTLDAHALPEECRAIAGEAKVATTPEARLAAYTKAASCMAGAELHALHVQPTKAAAAALDAALAPSMSLLDAVVKLGDARTQILANYAKADLYTGAAVALLASVDGKDVQSTLSGDAVTKREALLKEADTLAQPLRAHANDAYFEVERLGAANPELVANDKVVAFEVQVARSPH